MSSTFSNAFFTLFGASFNDSTICSACSSVNCSGTICSKIVSACCSLTVSSTDVTSTSSIACCWLMSVVRIASTIVATFCGEAVSSWVTIFVNACWLICPVSSVLAFFTASRVVSKRFKSCSAGKGRGFADSLNTVVSVLDGGALLVVGLDCFDDVVVGVSLGAGWLVVGIVVSALVGVVVVSKVGEEVDVAG